VDGNPQGLREVLYIRDDDYRLSFRYGNFATLTNLKPWDEARIVEYRLSPLYVSVHASDPVIRRWLLRNPEAPAVIPQLRGFGAQGIEFHAQVVLVPGVNDGATLGRTLTDLWGLGQPILSVAIVPVALTEYSKHQSVRQPTREECRAALALVSDFATGAVAERGQPWCFGADELYLRAEEPLPPAEWYGDFEQRENGVGAVRYLQTRIAAATEGLADLRGRRIAIATGTAMGPLMPQVVVDLERATGAEFEVLALENPLFGSAVTSAGLLPGVAFLAALRGRSDVDLALLPAEAVNDDLRFLDDLEAEALATRLPMPIRFSYDFADTLAETGQSESQTVGRTGGFRSDRSSARPSSGERG
jgi:putative radical SAM enzyme (TIGR03279 family)